MNSQIKSEMRSHNERNMEVNVNVKMRFLPPNIGTIKVEKSGDVNGRWLLLPFLAFLCLPFSAQPIDSSFQWPSSAWVELRKGGKRKAKKGRRNHDKDTGMFAFTVLTITSFPATNALAAKSEDDYTAAP